MALVSTIRQLDGIKTKTVAGFVIESNRPLPKPKSANGAVYEALCALHPGESFVHTNKAKDARQKVRKVCPDRSFAAREIEGGKFRIWRTK